jgi:hypothetical protein
MQKLIFGAMLLALAATGMGCTEHGSAAKPSTRATAHTSTSLTQHTMKPVQPSSATQTKATTAVSKPAETTKSAAKKP